MRAAERAEVIGITTWPLPTFGQYGDHRGFHVPTCPTTSPRARPEQRRRLRETSASMNSSTRRHCLPDKEREALYLEVQEILHEDVPVGWLMELGFRRCTL